MSSVMAFNRVWTREQVLEIYNIPSHLEKEVLAFLRPISGYGPSALYLESIVDRQLDKYFGQKIRLREEDAWSLSCKEESMKQTWADTVAVEDEEVSVKPLEPLLVDEEQAAKMLGVSRRKVFELNEAGDLACKRIGSRKLYSVARLREFAEGRVA